MSSKRAGLPSLNSAASSASKKGALQPVKVQRYRAGKAPEGYVDPALQSSDEDEDDQDESPSARRSAANAAGGIQLSFGSGQEERKSAYQVLNVEQMTRERQQERAQRGGQPDLSAAAAGGDRRLARLQAMQLSDQRSRGDTRSRRARDGSDEDEEEQEKSESSGDDEEEAALRRRKAARVKAMREEEEEELWGQGEEEDEEEEVEDSRRRGHAKVMEMFVWQSLFVFVYFASFSKCNLTLCSDDIALARTIGQ